MPDIPWLLAMVVVVALVFDFTNGAHDTANAIATVVSTKVLSPGKAVLMAGILNLMGALIGTHVAQTVGSGIVHPDMIRGCQALTLAALFGAIAWNLLTWYLGLPSSSSHALIGGLIGATLTYTGTEALNFASILRKILLPLMISPLAGFAAGYLMMLALSHVFCRAHPRKINRAFRKLQIVSSAFMATSHGTNDAQKTMGIITLALFVGHQIPDTRVPFWVQLSCALVMGMGTMVGGWKIIKTMGHKIFNLEAVHGFSAETSAAAVISVSSWFGAPISTTHVISASILGVGSSKRLSAVRWGVAGRMVTAWILTIPAAAAVAAACFEILWLLGLAQ
ncbi:MAG: inorganic phosphate transporter [Syntrophobacteraceae bacterium]|jgi:PiT family inorganic phosphate transporter|nr:inorganic phosphate transporter [Syntrophobacteraceae bacterium]